MSTVIHGSYFGLTGLEVGFVAGALLLTVLVGLVLVPVLRKAMAEDDDPSRLN
jgi:hypothetical protein